MGFFIKGGEKMALLLDLFIVFIKVGFCSFGGTSMIPVINDEMLAHGWMTTREVTDIVAIAEMTPGSLGINCATFVGLRTAGVLGAIVASLGVMVPSLTLCMAAAKFTQKFQDNDHLLDAMYAIRPVCVGMILAVALSLGLTTYIEFNILQLKPVLIGAIVLVLLLKFKWSIPKVIAISALLGLMIL